MTEKHKNKTYLQCITEGRPEPILEEELPPIIKMDKEEKN